MLTILDEQIQLQNLPDIIVKISEMLASTEHTANNLFRDVNAENASNCLLDACALKRNYDLAAATTDKLAHCEFRENEYLAGLVDILNSHNPDQLTETAVTCCKSTQLHLAMLGTFDISVAPLEQKARKARQAQKKETGPKLAPENVKQIIKKDKGAEKINLMRAEIQRVCRQRKTKKIPYFEVIINPTSFMKSVDAAFQIAFLVRDGILGLKRINNEPYILLSDIEKSQMHARGDTSDETVQTVMSISPKLWKEEIKKYKLKAPLLNLDKNLEDVEESDEDEDSDSDSD